MIEVEYVNCDYAFWGWNAFGSLKMWALVHFYTEKLGSQVRDMQKTLISVQVYDFWYIFLFF